MIQKLYLKIIELATHAAGSDLTHYKPIHLQKFKRNVDHLDLVEKLADKGVE